MQGDLGDDAHGADANAVRLEEVRVVDFVHAVDVPLGVENAQSHDLSRNVLVRLASAVGAGGCSTDVILHHFTAQIVHLEPFVVESRDQVNQVPASTEGDRVVALVHLHVLQVGQAEDVRPAVCLPDIHTGGQIAETVAIADRPHHGLAGVVLLDEVDEVCLIVGDEEPVRLAGNIFLPVEPAVG